MWFLGKRTPEKRSFIDILQKIKSGDRLLKDRFISDYQPFIIKSVSQILNNKYIDIENSEEYSVGLIAFNEAIEKYDEAKKCSFKKFSYQVMQRRLIDYRRKADKVKVYPFSYFEGDETYHFEYKYLIEKNTDHIYNFEIREEFVSFVNKMKNFGITMDDLVKNMPKHRDSRKTCASIAKLIAEDDGLYDKFKAKKTIPFKDIAKYVEVSQRTVERNRKYIIALVLILKSDLDIIKNYIKNLE